LAYSFFRNVDSEADIEGDCEYRTREMAQSDRLDARKPINFLLCESFVVFFHARIDGDSLIGCVYKKQVRCKKVR
jgi:hypothetical protein